MSCIVFSSAHELSRAHVRSTGKKERRFIESAMPADGTSAARCAHGDLGTSRLRAAEADVTRRLAHVKEASHPANDQLRSDGTPRDHFSIRGSILVDQRSWSPTSLSVTVMTSLAPSIATWPKNCSPKQGAKSSRCAPLHPFWKTARGPNVLSSFCGRQVPAWRGPEMNSQNGSKSWNTAALGS